MNPALLHRIARCGAVAAGCLLVASLGAADRIVVFSGAGGASTEYRVPYETRAGSGGGRATATAGAATYSLQATVGEIAGKTACASPVAFIKQGFQGQRWDYAGLEILSPFPTVNEGGTLQLQPRAVLQDASRLVLANNAAAWSVIAGFGTVSSTALFTAGNVYQDSITTVQAQFTPPGGSPFSAQLDLGVLDTIKDNFGIYAGDTIDDAWQVLYFGVNNPAGLATADPDGDGQNNLFEFIALTTPTSATSRFTVRVDPVSGQPGTKRITWGPVSTTRTYRVETKTDLSVTTWTALTANLPGTGTGTNSFDDTAATGTRRFYRVVVVKP